MRHAVEIIREREIKEMKKEKGKGKTKGKRKKWRKNKEIKMKSEGYYGHFTLLSTLQLGEDGKLFCQTFFQRQNRQTCSGTFVKGSTSSLNF
jgi:hypothetical protein